MHNAFTNLLPPERQKALSRDYVVRLSVVVVWFVNALTFIAALLLLPTYVFLTVSINAKKDHLANVESALSSADEMTLSARLTALSSDAATLVALAGVPSASSLIRTALAISRPGITLSAFTYTPASEKTPGTLSISGKAATRNALRAYQLALQSASFARSAALPVSAYAQDTDIAFTILATLAP